MFNVECASVVSVKCQLLPEKNPLKMYKKILYLIYKTKKKTTFRKYISLLYI